MGNLLRDFVETNYIHTFKEIAHKSLRCSIDHGLNELWALAKDVDELLIGQEEQPWKLASSPFQEVCEASSYMLAFLSVLHQDGQEILS